MAEAPYADRQRVARAQRRLRAQANLSHAPSLLSEQELSKSERPAQSLAVWLLAAFACHGGLAYAAWQVPNASTPPQDVIQVRVLAAPPKRIAPTPAAMPITSPPVAVPARRATPRKRAPTPNSLPEEVPPIPQPPVVGLGVESTVRDGTGPAFATGHTLSGVTDTVAASPPESAPLSVTPALPAVRVSRNRVARGQSAAGVHVQQARRLSQLEPEYPALLQSQRIEGDVTVRVTLSALGAVERVELVAGAREAAFNEAALAAARRERFSAETHDGRPVSTSITYSYRFRIQP